MLYNSCHHHDTERLLEVLRQDGLATLGALFHDEVPTMIESVTRFSRHASGRKKLKDGHRRCVLMALVRVLIESAEEVLPTERQRMAEFIKLQTSSDGRTVRVSDRNCTPGQTVHYSVKGVSPCVLPEGRPDYVEYSRRLKSAMKSSKQLFELLGIRHSHQVLQQEYGCDKVPELDTILSSAQFFCFWARPQCFAKLEAAVRTCGSIVGERGEADIKALQDRIQLEFFDKAPIRTKSGVVRISVPGVLGGQLIQYLEEQMLAECTSTKHDVKQLRMLIEQSLRSSLGKIRDSVSERYASHSHEYREAANAVIESYAESIHHKGCIPDVFNIGEELVEEGFDETAVFEITSFIVNHCCPEQYRHLIKLRHQEMYR